MHQAMDGSTDSPAPPSCSRSPSSDGGPVAMARSRLRAAKARCVSVCVDRDTYGDRRCGIRCNPTNFIKQTIQFIALPLPYTRTFPSKNSAAMPSPNLANSAPAAARKLRTTPGSGMRANSDLLDGGGGGGWSPRKATAEAVSDDPPPR